jgi:hypothetical protein
MGDPYLFKRVHLFLQLDSGLLQLLLPCAEFSCLRPDPLLRSRQICLKLANLHLTLLQLIPHARQSIPPFLHLNITLLYHLQIS